MLIRIELSQLGRIRKRKVLYDFSDAFDDGDEVRHGHLFLDDVAGHDENYTSN